MKIAAAAALAAVLLGAAAFMKPRSLPAAAEAVAVRAPFAESLIESGTITAARMALYGAPLGSVPAKIVELVPEGTAVEAGDPLVRLDTTPLEQLLARERAALARAESELSEHRDALQLKVRTERLQLLEADAALAEAERDVARARAAVEDLRPMLVEGFITRPEFDRAGQALLRAEDQRRLAAARRELRASALPAGAGQDAAAAAPRAASALVDEIRLRIQALQHQIAVSTIVADAPGLVVYREMFFGSERRKPQVGDEALPNQPLLAVPDASALMVETRVREIDLHRVASSQRVTVRVDAYPGLVIDGRIDVVGALAQSDAARAGTRYFPVTVRLDRIDSRLRAGMTAQVRIDLAAIPAAIVVPLEALFEDDEGFYCLVVEDGGVTRRPVSVWARTETHAAIRTGIAAGVRLRLERGER
ncbi:MAG TPA: efflux RND transporter periplasmic adaptor subunit [Vicinamibacterales bacterium]